MPYYISPPPQTPLTRFITAIIAVFVLVGTFMIGVAALLVVAVLGLIAAIGIWLRVAWIKRRLQKSGVNVDINTNIPPASGHVIDAEYTVISGQQDHDDE
jgi:hypothetical protein